MTPMSAAPPAPQQPVPAHATASPRAPGAGGGSGEPNAFARALQRQQGADGSPDTPRPATADPVEGGAGPADSEPLSRVAGDALAMAASELPDAALVDVQQPAPVWPPTGLAGLFGFPEADASTEPVTPGAVALTRSPAAISVLPTLSSPAPDAAALPIPNADAAEMPALPLAGMLAEQAAPIDGGEPAPVAFALPAPATLREPPPLLAAPLPTPHVGGEDFEADVGAQLEWMAEQKIGHARIRVTPNDYGPIDVRLTLDGDRIRADFVSGHAETRQALEHGLPRLRDLLGEHGFQLAHAGVGSGQGGDGDASGSAPGRNAADTADDSVGPLAERVTGRRMLGLLDAYA